MSRDAIRNKFNLFDINHFLALGFGSGLSRFAPGTVGTIAAIPLFWFASALSLQWYLAITAVMCVVGVYICGKCAFDVGVHDHPAIVWDEFAGFFVTMIAVPREWHYILIGFALFRFFDIIKPWPIGFLDRKMRGGLGIMVDDILAGFYALVVMQIIIYYQL
ncbi:phosphatidylglycerophosphatase A family protein [Flocculibacter collagenilyticus]|uniref:phosphatidylglycerophosphatase A family protein n=1 Tax=Flocculibacter collagenilyticus TaxID=2744479 RepID=UPI0018F5B87B|nr:phosphatidylglycerophosphatase A [Flocculibacter collagenilyticus]